MRKENVEHRRAPAAPIALALGWLVPGAGHLYLSRRGRGATFLGIIVAMFVAGVAMNARLAVHVGWDDPLATLTSFAQMAAGLPYLVARALGFSIGQVTAVTYEYGNTFTAVAGLLNALVALDAYDIAIGRKG